MAENGRMRWASEQAFFDSKEYSGGPLPSETVDRYMNCRHPFTPAEYPFRALGDIRGKHILEPACGDGANSVLLALKGACVVGVAVSSRAIEAARRRARLHGVEAPTEFHPSPAETCLDRAGRRFDIICGFAILHHLLPVLDSVLKALSGDPPPPARHAASDVRLSGAHLGRLVSGRYEDHPPLCRAVCHLLCRIDRGLLSLPGLKVLGSAAVILSRPGGSAGCAARPKVG